MHQTNHEPGGIVCATRGGVGSEPTVQGAIELAREHGLRLTFLYIADLEFMKHTDMGRTNLVSEEVRKMGEFIMMTLVERAREEGVEADFAVRKGNFQEELVRYLKEMRPVMLVLGSPKPDTACLDLDSLDRLMQTIKEETGIPVVCA